MAGWTEATCTQKSDELLPLFRSLKPFSKKVGPTYRREKEVGGKVYLGEPSLMVKERDQ